MAWCPFATKKELPESKTQPTIAPRTIILHSAVSSAASLHPYFSRSDVKLESHFYVANDGRIEQYVDTTRRADANNKANSFAVSIETADHGDPDSQPWNDAQLWAIERLVRWIATTHRIPLRRCPSWVEGGIGYHTMWGAPSPWTPVVKTCPGRARILQFNSHLMPRLEGAEEEDVFSTFFALVADTYWRVANRAPDPKGHLLWVEQFENAAKQGPIHLAAEYQALVAGLKAEVDRANG